MQCVTKIFIAHVKFIAVARANKYIQRPFYTQVCIIKKWLLRQNFKTYTGEQKRECVCVCAGVVGVNTQQRMFCMCIFLWVKRNSYVLAKLSLSYPKRNLHGVTRSFFKNKRYREICCVFAHRMLFRANECTKQQTAWNATNELPAKSLKKWHRIVKQQRVCVCESTALCNGVQSKKALNQRFIMAPSQDKCDCIKQLSAVA